MRTVDKVEARLATSTAAAYRRCAAAAPRSFAELVQAVERYLQVIQTRATASEFFDLGTAERVVSRCRALLERLGHDPSPEAHQAVQAAVEYLVLDDDGEADQSIVGFDDDLRVVSVTAEVLGWDLPEDDA